jgi:uncharacterized membrane protein SpoIIM required for sporulation
MSRELELDGVAGQNAPLAELAVEDAAVARPASRAFVWDWPSFVRCGKAFAGAVLSVFVLGVMVGALVPGLPSRVLNAIQSVVLWPSDYFAQLIPLYLLILLANMKASFLTALLGPASVWVNARLNAARSEEREWGGGPPGLVTRLACGVAAATVRAGRAVFPEIGDQRREFAARSSAGLAAVVPFLALWVNGAVLGLWLAEGLITDWLAGLAHVGCMLLPHGPVEFTAIILSAAIGLRLARQLVPVRPQDDSHWQAGHAKQCLTSDSLAQSLGLLVGLLAIAAALELLAWV